jgi:hypothetical protein
VWTVGDFAKFCGVTPHIARRMLADFDREMGGALLSARTGSVGWTFIPAQLRKHPRAKHLFEPLGSVEKRLDDLEEAENRNQIEHRQIASAVGQNTRDIIKLRARVAVG